MTNYYDISEDQARFITFNLIEALRMEKCKKFGKQSNKHLYVELHLSNID